MHVNHYAYACKCVNQSSLTKFYPVNNYKTVGTIGHVNIIPTMQFFAGIFRNTRSKLYMLSLTECVWDFQNNALWETR